MSTFEQNKADAAGFLKQFEHGVMNYIDGEQKPALDGTWFDTDSPVDLKFLAKVARGKEQDIDLAAAAAARGFKVWSAMDGKQRQKILHAIADGIVARAREIALLECIDTGQSLKFMAKAALRGAENFRFFADKAVEAQDGQSLYLAGQVNITKRYPIGPVGVITPWNTPFMLSTWKIAPALAAGCSIVHKPAEFSPLTANLLAQIANEAGLPKGVWNLVNGMGEDAGKRLTEHPLIKAIAFVGESSTGSLIQKQGADTLKRAHFELGGKNPILVFADADLEKAADAAVFMIYSLNGERCTSSSRLLVEESIYEHFCTMVADRANNIKVGHPLDPETVIGPLVHPEHEAKVLSYFETAKAEGASIAAGGKKVANLNGCFVQPTLFTQAHNKMRIAQEEIFGPVLTAIPFKDDEDAVAIANDVEYGLAGYLWSQNVERCWKIADQLEAGMVWVNSENSRHLPAPFGGVKASGIGRDGGDWSFEFYMETKNISFAMAGHTPPKLDK
ncbi:MAG: 5-carboxymethyl-2-hydroxymuconate semialdehyde dehydrogenase [Gammaproteobacteria bacterium]|jgi:5-carboxymethyl-2-hydroxymuconic-semialdehyde dehydrogenase|nr:5-carboxymethyl-2-hydroxymuconate semialdehyde dehydrogenase [Gammaproteobacteria bacterium]MDP6166173.1 5-carboxymethyl-2-hydroxymuconate semialdehyde dehydrogenase [Gammaproteobacteria bacterium]